jgi:hypothetical protein
MGTRELRAALVEKTGWTKQTLSRHVQALKNELPMETGTAQCVLAHRRGLRVDRYLDAAALANVQAVLARLGGGPGGGVTRGRAETGNGTATSGARPIVFPKEFKTSDPLLSDAKLLEAREMATVYPILYVMENSMREVIQRVMTAKYGADWWNTALTSGKVKNLKDTSDQRRAKEGQMQWHQRRGAHPLDYVNLDDLATIIDAKQDDFFPQVLGDREWFKQFMRELAPSRNVLCHMNPLDSHNVRDIKVKAERWRKLIEGHLDSIPSET